MRSFHKNTQAPAILRMQGPAETQKLINEVVGGNVNPKPNDLYRHSDVKQQLKIDQNGKCAYCERYFNGDFGAVEHFRPKGGWKQSNGDKLLQPGYYWLTYEWSNLLYSCDECNTVYKHNLFPLANPGSRDIDHRNISKEQPLLVNPAEEDPGIYIAFHSEMAIPRIVAGLPSAKGKATIELLGLNSRPALKQARREAYMEYRKFVILKEIARREGNALLLRMAEGLIRTRTGEYAEFTGMYQYQEEVFL